MQPSPRRRDVRADVQRIAHVLADLEYPAAKWRVLAEADHYGADAQTRAQLWALPSGVYEDLDGVLAGLGLPVGIAARTGSTVRVPRDVMHRREILRQREVLRQQAAAAHAARHRPARHRPAR